MVTLKINGTRYNFPTCWKDVTYTQYVYHILPRTLAESIHCFTGIPLETIQKASIPNLEKINIALSFMNISPAFAQTLIVGKYILPADVTIQSLGQFEDLRGLLKKVPASLDTYEELLVMSDLYLHACAIYVQKIKDGEYDWSKVEVVKQELKNESCWEVIGNGAFFLSRPANTLQPTTSLYQKLIQRLKRWSQDLPGYQKTLDFLLRSSGSQGK